MNEAATVGILTSGGDAPGMNAAVRAAFRALKMRDPNCTILFYHDGFRGLAKKFDPITMREVDRRDVRNIIHRGGTFLGTGRVSELIPPSEQKPGEGYQKEIVRHEQFVQKAIDNLYQAQVSHLIVVGGDGSFRGAQIIAEAFRKAHPERPFAVVGIPATIDNDVYGTLFSIGFDTALNNVVEAIRKIRDTVESHKRAIVLEVMGNASGWLALHSAIAGGASYVAVPEIEATYHHDEILNCLIAGALRDYRYFIIIVAEGVLKRAGTQWSQELKNRIEQDMHLQQALGMPMEARINSVGHLARGGSPSALDNTLAGFLGAAAADIIQLGHLPHEKVSVQANLDVMVGYQGAFVQTLPLAEVIQNSPHLITPQSELYQLACKLTLRAKQPF